MAENWNKAVKEAYTMAPSNEIVYFTIELRHPTFFDDQGNRTAIRLVQEYDDVMLGIENDPTIPNFGEMVKFIGTQFVITLPPTDKERPTSLNIRVDGVSREIVKYLENAIAQTDPIEVTFRTYLASEPQRPQSDPPIHLTMSSCTVDVFTVTGTANLEDLFNRPFPFLKFTREQYKDLGR